MGIKIVTVLAIGGIILFMGIFSITKKSLPVIGMDDWFEGSKGKLISIGFIAVGGLFVLSAIVAPDMAMNLIDRAFSGCTRKD